MRNIQRLMVLHEEANITITHIDRNNVAILIEGNYTEEWRKSESYDSQTKVDLTQGSLLEALELAANMAIERMDGCRCLNPGQDDGNNTCWKHHDCNDGSCTHGE